MGAIFANNKCITLIEHPLKNEVSSLHYLQIELGTIIT